MTVLGLRNRQLTFRVLQLLLSFKFLGTELLLNLPLQLLILDQQGVVLVLDLSLVCVRACIALIFALHKHQLLLRCGNLGCELVYLCLEEGLLVFQLFDA